MESLAYWLASAAIWLIQRAPLRALAWIGRRGGRVFYVFDARHRRVALRNLERVFGEEKSAAEREAICREHFRRLGENYLCAIKTAGMSNAQLEDVLTVQSAPALDQAVRETPAPRLVFACGHFGNFELYSRAVGPLPGYQFLATYRALRQRSLNRLLERLRAQSGCLLFERRREGAALRRRLAGSRIALGILADQCAGRRGLTLPFFGIDCSTSPAPAVLALRYDARLFTAACYRVAPARWRIEVGDEIPTHCEGRARSSAEIMLDVNRALEKAVQRDLPNWFWVHRRWKPVRRANAFAPKPAPARQPQS